METTPEVMMSKREKRKELFHKHGYADFSG
jgi:hypothetical protein